MKFSAAFLAFGLVAAVVAQTPTETEPASPQPTSEQQKCVTACKSDVTCSAKCLGNPAPTKDMVDATTKCMAACPQGSGTATETATYAACQQKCITDQFLTDGSGSGSSGSGSGSSGSDSGSSGSGSGSGGSGSGSDNTSTDSTKDTGSKSSNTTTTTKTSNTPSSGSASGNSGTETSKTDTSSGSASSFAISGIIGVLAIVSAAVALL